jgi:N-methylhydantoinase A/oxoprolinase/acetone carboxylase beta subunit
MGKLINIDNGGTLTDFCVLDGAQVYTTKSLTTPHDLSKCLFDGLRKMAREVYGTEEVDRLLQETDCIRYSTTQGTNALVERKGPRLGLLVASGGAMPEGATELAASLVGDRVGMLGTDFEDPAFDQVVVRAVNALASQGANRIVVSLDCEDFEAQERRIRQVVRRTYPCHLLGAVPLLFASEINNDADYARRTWTALFNAFLHPAMERFLYHTDHRLKQFHTRNPLLVFRNDGGSARVAKTTAIKTYSSGPRGGMEGARALAEHYGIRRLLTCDIGGTTTDIGLVEEGEIAAHRHGFVEGVAIAFPLCDVFSAGVGGSSVIRVVDGVLRVGPDSVGAAPGPACFGLGGKQATITDAFLLLGLLDPEAYFGGDLALSRERAETAVVAQVADPLGCNLPDALEAMVEAWIGAIAEAIRGHFALTPDTTLAAFGGAGAFAAAQVAARLGIDRVILPGLAAVFSAFGVGFSDLAQEYQVHLDLSDEGTWREAVGTLRARARRDMFAEGIAIDDCTVEACVLAGNGAETERHVLDDACALPPTLAGTTPLTLQMRVVKRLARGRFNSGDTPVAAVAPVHGTRWMLGCDGPREIPLYRVESLAPGHAASGPAIIEDPYFTGLVDQDWRFRLTANRDLILEREGKSA